MNKRMVAPGISMNKNNTYSVDIMRGGKKYPLTGVTIEEALNHWTYIDNKYPSKQKGLRIRREKQSEALESCRRLLSNL